MQLKSVVWIIVGLICAAGASWGDIIDPLHGCIIGTSCFDNGTVTPTTTNPLPNFTFTISPGPQTGDFLVELLVPDNLDTTPALLSFSISGTSGGATDTSPIGPFSSTLKGHWTSGGLGAFLGLTLGSGSPLNDISAWLPSTQGSNCGSLQNAICDPAATGYEVYQLDLGNNELQGASNPTKPVLTLSGSGLPAASLLAGFLGNGSTFGTSSSFISTANSGAIFEAGKASVPEPNSVWLLGALLLIGFVSRSMWLSRKTSER
jgi:hypothetical protein